MITTKRLLLLGFGLSAALAGVTPANAYESQCRWDYPGTLDESVREPLSSPECAGPLQSARGRLFGEHTWLAREAMRYARLDPLTEVPVFSTYYTSGEEVAGSGMMSAAPAVGAAMVTAYARGTTIPEFSQIPDVSSGLSDYVLGNEHCFVTREADQSLELCHDFAKRLGPVNATHFGAQGRAAYGLYHSLAIQTAQQCALMKRALERPVDAQTPLPRQSHERQLADVAMCERYALAVEAVGSHYLTDAWSSGHMWQRWGSPLFPTDPAEAARLQVLGIVAGQIHGWRSVVEKNLHKIPAVVLSKWPDLAHDQMCMPGYVDSDEQARHEHVEWRDTAAPDAGLVSGVGDLYVFRELAKPVRDSVWSWTLLDTPELDPQRRRMLSCLASGFNEVYAAGPRTLGNLTPVILDPLIDSVESPHCWGQRVTNRTFWLGMGGSAVRMTRNPWIAAKMALVFSGMAGVSSEQLTAMEAQLRFQYVALTAEAKYWALHDPDGNQMAELGTFTSLLGFGRNLAYAPLVASGGVPYLENPFREGWNPRSLGPGCVDDHACGAAQYCQARGPVSVARCAPKETAVMAAFREAETPAWCAAADGESIGALATRCRGGGTAAACAPCVDAVLPHIRNACGVNAYHRGAPTLAGAARFDQRSGCDLYRDGGIIDVDPLAVYEPYDPSAPTGLADAALAFCRRGEAPSHHADVTYPLAGTPPATAENIHAPTHDGCHAFDMCGAGAGTLWRRFSHVGTPDGDVHRIRVDLARRGTSVGAHAAVDDVEVTLHAGPACSAVVATGVPLDQDSIEVIWNVPAGAASEVCLRVRARRYDAAMQVDITDDHDMGGTCGPIGQLFASFDSIMFTTASHGTIGWGYSVGMMASVGGMLPLGATDDMTGAGRGACRLNPEGTVTCWEFYFGTRMIATPTGELLRDVVDVDGGCAVRSDGTVWCWPLTPFVSKGFSALPSYAPVSNQSPADWYDAYPIVGISDVVRLSRGHTDPVCGIRADGTVDCAAYAVGHPITGWAESLQNVVDLTMVGGHGCALLRDGTLRCSTTAPEQHTFVAGLDGLTGIKRIALTHGHGCVLRVDGSVACAGYDQALGDPTLIAYWPEPSRYYASPVPVPGINDAVDIAVGRGGTCARKRDASIWCWGRCWDGECGDLAGWGASEILAPPEQRWPYPPPEGGGGEGGGGCEGEGCWSEGGGGCEGEGCWSEGG